MVMTTGFQKAAIRSSAMFGLGMVFTNPHDTPSVGALQLKLRTRFQAAREVKPARSKKWFVGGFAVEKPGDGIVLSDGDGKTDGWFTEYEVTPGGKYDVRAFVMPFAAELYPIKKDGKKSLDGNYDQSNTAAKDEVDYLNHLVRIVERFADLDSEQHDTGPGFLSLNSKSATMFMQLLALALSIDGAKRAFFLVDDEVTRLANKAFELIQVLNSTHKPKRIILTAPVYKENANIDNREVFINFMNSSLPQSISVVMGSHERQNIGHPDAKKIVMSSSPGG